MSVIDLVREDLLDFRGYRSARSERLPGDVLLNANESAWASATDPAGILRSYPEPQPELLRARLAATYGCAPSQLLAARGSDEGIDLLVRALCRPGDDAVVITTPTFGMYAVGARLQGARVIDVPLAEDGRGGFRCDFDAVALAAKTEAAKIVFLCSPGNPGGNLLPLDGIAQLAERLRDAAVVAVDEAYLEFAQTPSAVTLLAQHDNVVVLRTLSKAHALAAARVGCVIASPGLIDMMQRCQAPYPLPTPSVEAALAALSDPSLEETALRVRQIVAERERLRLALTAARGIRVAESHANFLLVRFPDAQAAYDRLLTGGIVVRDVRASTGLPDALRISIGTPAQNERVLAIVRDLATAGAAA